MDFTKILSSFNSVFKNSPVKIKSSTNGCVLIVSPHPDDECIMSSLALRLKIENNAKIINTAVTLGSKIERQKERSIELRNASHVLGIESVILSENWLKKEKELKALIQKYNPKIIIAPHIKDGHPTHIKTAKLVKKVLSSKKIMPTIIAWSEFWGQNPKNNIIVEVPTDILEIQMKSLEMHKGEIERNPYHLRLPAWMIDNVRRAEQVIGQSQKVPEFAFGSLYQLEFVKNGKFKKIKLLNPIWTYDLDLNQILKLILDAASLSKTKVK